MRLRPEPATPEEAAAVMAAVARFEAEVVLPPAPGEEGGADGRWVRAARREGVDRAPVREGWAG
jgi:hypothetical protein